MWEVRHEIHCAVVFELLVSNKWPSLLKPKFIQSGVINPGDILETFSKAQEQQV